MMKIKLRERLISELGLMELDKAERYRIADDFVQLAVEKTMDDLINEMNSGEVENLQKYMNKDPKDLSEIYQKHHESLENFFIIFNKNLNELIGEFQKNTR